jgi:large subunit ribosomal protein L22
MATTITAPHARATARYQRVSPYKVRQVLDLVRGMSVDDAVRALQLSGKDAADDVLKVLDSAVANAEHNFQLPAEELYVAVAYADEGPTRKWGQPRARGRYFRIRRRTSHITLIVARYDEDELERRRRRDETTGRGASAARRQRAERVRRSRQRAHEAEHDHEHEDDDARDAQAAAVAADTLAEEAAQAAAGEGVDVDAAIEDAESAEAAADTDVDTEADTEADGGPDEGEET